MRFFLHNCLPQVVRPRQGGDELQGVGGEASHDPVCATDEDEVLAKAKAVGACRLRNQFENTHRYLFGRSGKYFSNLAFFSLLKFFFVYISRLLLSKKLFPLIHPPPPLRSLYLDSPGKLLLPLSQLQIYDPSWRKRKGKEIENERLLLFLSDAAGSLPSEPIFPLPIFQHVLVLCEKLPKLCEPTRSLFCCKKRRHSPFKLFLPLPIRLPLKKESLPTHQANENILGFPQKKLCEAVFLHRKQ